MEKEMDQEKAIRNAIEEIEVAIENHAREIDFHKDCLNDLEQRLFYLKNKLYGKH